MEFFDLVIPQGGETCTVTIYPNGVTSQKFVNLQDPKVIRGKIFHANEANANLYFAMATFRTPTKRTKANAESLKCFWVDLDAGEKKYKKHGDKVYRTRGEAIEDFADFLDFTGFIEPTYIVSSGEGWHLYWVMDQALTPEEWFPIASAFRQYCTVHELRVDAPLMIDYAHILRVPGSRHQASQNTVEIKRRSATEVIAVQDFKDAIEHRVKIDYNLEDADRSHNLELGERPDYLIAKAPGKEWDSLQAKFTKDFSRCLGTTGCDQLKFSYEHQDQVNENLWRATMSVVHSCEDSESWAIKVSEHHPAYSEEQTLEKLRKTEDKPYTCETFNILNPDVCKNCMHYEKIKSPAVLTLIPLVSTEAVEIEVKPAVNKAPDKGVKIADIEDLGDLSLLTTSIPEFPAPFSRHKDGGLWVESDGVFTEICPHDVYVMDRMYDPVQAGEVMLIRFHTPNDGLRQFTIANEMLIGTGTDAIKVLAKHGITLNMEKSKQMVSFLRLSMQQMIQDSSAQKRRDNFGWTEDNNSFVLGNVEFYQDSTARPVIPTERIEVFASSFTPVVTADWAAWADAADMYNHPGMEANWFVLATALSSPLYALDNVSGGIVHLYSTASGTGKTTSAQVGLSIWGVPVKGTGKKELSSINGDTMVATFTKASVFKSVPMYIDEITTRPVHELRDTVYAFTQGRDKDRGEAGSNNIRVNNSTWESCAITSGNRSLYDSLGRSGDISEALLARMIEIEFSHNLSLRKFYTADEIKHRIDIMQLQNYGIIGQRFIRWMITRVDEVRTRLKKARADLNRLLQFSQSERYWENMLVCSLTAYRIGYELEFWDYPEAPLLEFMKGLIRKTREETKYSSNSTADLLSMFLNDHIGERLIVVSDKNDSGKAYARRVPNQTISIREELHTGQLFIRRESLEHWCNENNYGYTKLKTELQHAGAKEVRKNLAADTIFSGSEDTEVASSNSARQRVLQISYAAIGLLPEDVEQLED